MSFIKQPPVRERAEAAKSNLKKKFRFDSRKTKFWFKNPKCRFNNWQHTYSYFVHWNSHLLRNVI